MSVSLFLKTSIIWFVIAILAVLNGIFRENILVTSIGQSMAVPVSGITLSIIVFIVTYISFPLFSKKNTMTYLFIGLQWVSMTLIFEFLFGHYVLGKSWSSILDVFDIMRGDLFIIVLFVSLISPLLVAQIKGK